MPSGSEDGRGSWAFASGGRQRPRRGGSSPASRRCVISLRSSSVADARRTPEQQRVSEPCLFVAFSTRQGRFLHHFTEDPTTGHAREIPRKGGTRSRVV